MTHRDRIVELLRRKTSGPRGRGGVRLSYVDAETILRLLEPGSRPAPVVGASRLAGPEGGPAGRLTNDGRKRIREAIDARRREINRRTIPIERALDRAARPR